MMEIFWILIIFTIVVIYGHNRRNGTSQLSLKDYRQKIFPYQLHQTPLTKKELDNSLFRKYFSDEPTVTFLTKLHKFMRDPQNHSMADKVQIDQTEKILSDIIHRKIPGDLVEIGVWKGGMAMWMKAILTYYRCPKDIYLYDTFSSFPLAVHQKDRQVNNIVQIIYSGTYNYQTVINNFQKLGLLDHQIKFIKGKIEETFRQRPQQIALLRIDCDYYHSVLFSLEKFYFHIVPGGYVIVDDYENPYVACKEAVDWFRSKYAIKQPIQFSGQSVHWMV